MHIVRTIILRLFIDLDSVESLRGSVQVLPGKETRSFVNEQMLIACLRKMALDVSQAVPEQSVYLDDRPLFAEIARDLGINGIHHTDLDTTKTELEKLGLTV